jgi:endonuclease/exonuclease/phosphatase (EEP) superfamily protein YafD
LAICTWLYVAAVLAVWLLLRFAGDRWWFATVLLFAPRWLYVVPWAALVPAAAVARRRLLWPLAAIAVVLLVPIMGLCLPWARLVAPEGSTLRVLTCNIDGGNGDAARFAALVVDSRADVVAIQENPADPPLRWPAGWHVRCVGELLVASRYPLDNVELAQRQNPPSRWLPFNGLRCTVETPRGPVKFCCVHLHTPHFGLSEVLDRQTLVSPARSTRLTDEIAERRRESAELLKWLQGSPGPWIVAGDFNMPTDSAIYRDTWAGYVNAFSVSGCGFGYTKWTPIGGWTYGARIDHILAAPGIKACRSWVGPDVGSDHLPLLADLSVSPTKP